MLTEEVNGWYGLWFGSAHIPAWPDKDGIVDWYEQMKRLHHEARTHYDQPYEDDFIRLHFMGDMLCSSHSKIDFHRNPGYEFCLIPTGKGLFKIDTYPYPELQDHSQAAISKTQTDAVVYPVEKDQLFLTKMHQVHGGWPAAETPFRILYLCLEIKEGTACEDEFWQDTALRLDATDLPVCTDREGMQWLHHKLMEESAERLLRPTSAKNDPADMMQSLLRLFVMIFLRNAAHARDIIRAPLPSMAIIHFLDSHLTDELSLAEIAVVHHLSVSALSRRFRRETGFSVMEYCHMARLEKAKHLLTNSNESITTISETLRFGSIHHFSHAFKSMYGISPSAHRRVTAIQAAMEAQIVGPIIQCK